MNREHCRDETASPQAGGRLLEKNKKKYRGGAVKENIHKMMGAWIQAEQLAIEHVRDGRERMPVLRMNMGERPPDAAPGQACAHMHVVEHVKRIVVVNELMPKCLAENRPGERNQKNADAEQRPARVLFAHNSSRQLVRVPLIGISYPIGLSPTALAPGIFGHRDSSGRS